MISEIKMSCIICQDKGNEPLTDNKRCECKFKIHNSCWIDYVNSQKELKCMMCRKDISVVPKTKTTLKRPATASTPLRSPEPSAPYTTPFLQNNGTPISVEEFHEILRNTTNSYQAENVTITVNTASTQTNLSTLSNQNTNTSTNGSTPTELQKKLLAVLVGLIAVAALVALIIIMG